VTPTSDTFLRAIRLNEVEPDTFVATTQDAPWPKAYGGDLVAQSAASACATVDDERVLHSMHSYFMRPAEIGAEVSYSVERLRDGRSYSTREVRAYQGGKVIFITLASFHTEDDVDEFAIQLPPDLPAPESLPSAAAALADVDTAAGRYWSTGRSFDIRHVPSPLYVQVEGERSPRQAVWLRAFSPLPDDALIHRLALAYVSDYTILEPILRRQGRAWGDAGLVTASLDNSLWFHRDGRLDEWVLYTQAAQSAGQGRGLASGSFFTRTGELLATISQEGMIRPSR
jgi:acyl-CoA thioesterase-2